MDKDPQTEPAWARYQASKTTAQIAARDAFHASLGSPSHRPTPYTAEQQARHDQLQDLLNACSRAGLSASALDWMFATPKKASDVMPVKAGYDAWLNGAEKKALRPYLPMQDRRNASDPTEILDLAMAALATGIPLSRTSEKLAAAFNRAARRGLWDVLLEALAGGQLDDALSQSRRDQIARVARQGSKQGKTLRSRDAQRKASSDDLAKSRRTRAMA